jgi:hypothetical protein
VGAYVPLHHGLQSRIQFAAEKSILTRPEWQFNAKGVRNFEAGVLLVARLLKNAAKNEDGFVNRKVSILDSRP